MISIANRSWKAYKIYIIKHKDLRLEKKIMLLLQRNNKFDQGKHKIIKNPEMEQFLKLRMWRIKMDIFFFERKKGIVIKKFFFSISSIL